MLNGYDVAESSNNVPCKVIKQEVAVGKYSLRNQILLSSL